VLPLLLSLSLLLPSVLWGLWKLPLSSVLSGLLLPLWLLSLLLPLSV
jgi:hypothetical protein